MNALPRYCLLLWAVVPIACGRLQGQEEATTRPAYELTAEEVRLACALAERDLNIPSRPLSPLDRIVFSKIDLLPGPSADSGGRWVIVRHYRYRDDAVILTTVDLNRLEVVDVETVAHLPTALAPEELARAERLARADSRLRPTFEMPGRTLTVEGRPIQAAQSHEPLFGHRVLHLLLRHGADGQAARYLTAPRVLVDLSTETVLIDE
jgi:hypothetical protein